MISQVNSESVGEKKKPNIFILNEELFTSVVSLKL